MAFTLDTMRNNILTSIHGRRVGLDKDDFLLGHKGIRMPITEDVSGLGASAVIAGVGTGTSIANYGLTRVVSSAGSTANTGFAFTLQAPVAGARKIIYKYGASTSAHVFGLSGSAVVQGGSLTSAGSTMISMWRQNAMVELLGISTAIWLHLNSRTSGNASSDAIGISYSATVSS